MEDSNTFADALLFSCASAARRIPVCMKTGQNKDSRCLYVSGFKNPIDLTEGELRQEKEAGSLPHVPTVPQLGLAHSGTGRQSVVADCRLLRRHDYCHSALHDKDLCPRLLISKVWDLSAGLAALLQHGKPSTASSSSTC